MPDLRVFWTLPEGTEVMSKLLEPKYVEEGMAILDLFTFWRGWEHDVIVRQQLSKEYQITVKNIAILQTVMTFSLCS